MQDIEQQRTHFEAQADAYLKARESLRHQALKQEMWDSLFSPSIVEHLTRRSPIRMLEPMCGACDGKAIVEEFLGLDMEYSGFDYSPAMVRAAGQRFPDARIWEQDVTKFEPDGEYDLIMLMGALHHVANHADDVVARLSSALAPGGLFVLSEPVHNNLLFRLIREKIYRTNDSFDEETERGFTTKELNGIFAKHGMQSVREVYPSMLAYVLWGCPEAFPALDKGPLPLVRRYIKAERTFWQTRLAKHLTFGMFSVYQRPA